MEDHAPEQISPDMRSSVKIYTNIDPNSNTYVTNTRGRASVSVENGQIQGPLSVLFRITDIVLIIWAAMFAISLAVIFLIVVLGVVRAYSIRGFYGSNRDFEVTKNQ